MRLIIDRIEEGMAVCEDPSGKRHMFALCDLPQGVVEGELLTYENGIFLRDPKATQERRKYMQRLMDDVFE